MPVYFLHITEGSEVTADTEGIERVDLASVQELAFHGASDLMYEAVKRGERNYQGRIDVEDAQGRRVLKLTFACPVLVEVLSQNKHP